MDVMMLLKPIRINLGRSIRLLNFLLQQSLRVDEPVSSSKWRIYVSRFSSSNQPSRTISSTQLQEVRFSFIYLFFFKYISNGLKFESSIICGDEWLVDRQVHLKRFRMAQEMTNELKHVYLDHLIRQR